jgi:hypothetical protein
MGVYSRFPMLINPRTRCGYLLLLLLNPGLGHPNLLNPGLGSSYNDQSHTYEEFNKIGINQVKQHNMILTKAPILKY